MVSTSESPQLDYAPRSQSARRRVIYRWLIAASIVLALYFCRDWPAEVWQDSRVYFLQVQCLRHPVQPGIVVYQSGTPAICVAVPQVAALSAAYWRHPSWTAKQKVSTVFSGELGTNRGLRRVITVESGVREGPGLDATATFFTTSAALGRPITVISTGGEASSSWGIPIAPPTPVVVIYSANTDPKDPSHIQFICLFFDTKQVWDGYLRDDGSFDLTPSSIRRTGATGN